MSTTTIVADPVAGWYEDPLSPSAVRWWNGRGWTEHTQSPPAPPGDFATSWATFSDGPSTTPAIVHTVVAASTTSAQRSPSRNEYIPMRGHMTGVDHTADVVTGRSWLQPTHWSTSAVWAMAFTPWINTAITVTIGVLAAVGARWFVMSAALLLMPLLWIVFAMRDRRRLLEFGYEKRASWAWVLLSPIAYLIARGVRVHRVSGRGWAPLWVLLANVVIVAGVDLGVFVAVQADLLPQHIHSLEATIANDYASQGVAATVRCPTVGVTLLPGSSFLCTANAAGRTESIAVHVSAAGRLSYLPATATPGS